MKYTVFLVCVFGAHALTSSLRQKQQILDGFRFPTGAHPKLLQSHGPNTHAVSPGGMFEFNITSYESAKNISHLVAALQVAGGFFENAIRFTNPIKVWVTHGSYCGSACLPDDRNLGYCSANVKYHKDLNNQVATPYALIHQKQKDREIHVDMEMHISNSFDFVNPGEYGGHNHKYVDITETIVHEICHGLGIHSSIDNYFVDIPGQSNGTPNNLVEIPAYKNLFDTFVYFHDAPDTTTTNSSYREKSSIDIASLKQRKSLYFLTNHNSKIHLATGSKGDTPSHFDQDYEDTTDFLMATGSVPYAHFLKFQNIPNWKTSPLGPKTIEILETLGYKRNPTPEHSKSQLGLYEKMRPFNKKEGDEQFIPNQ